MDRPTAAAIGLWVCLTGCDPSPTLPPATPILPPPPLEPEQRVALAEILFASKGCAACHGEGGVAAALMAQPGATRQFQDGSSLVLTDDVRESYIRESITDPHRRVVEGFAPIMPPVQLIPAEIEDLVLYLECHSRCDGACWPACDASDRTAEDRGWWSPIAGPLR